MLSWPLSKITKNMNKLWKPQQWVRPSLSKHLPSQIPSWWLTWRSKISWRLSASVAVTRWTCARWSLASTFSSWWKPSYPRKKTRSRCTILSKLSQWSLRLYLWSIHSCLLEKMIFSYQALWVRLRLPKPSISRRRGPTSPIMRCKIRSSLQLRKYSPGSSMSMRTTVRDPFVVRLFKL